MRTTSTCTAAPANGRYRAQPTRKRANGTALYPAIVPAWVDGMTMEGVSGVKVVGGAVRFQELLEHALRARDGRERGGIPGGDWTCDNGNGKPCENRPGQRLRCRQCARQGEKILKCETSLCTRYTREGDPPYLPLYEA